MPNESMRADMALVARGLAPSRAQAQALIQAGQAALNGRPVEKPSQPVNPDDDLAVTGEACPYVSRGGLKLEKALAAFGCDPRGLVCLDVGASTGGFTDVLLRAGAAHVYALDVGEGQLSPVIAGDARVTAMEHTNARYLTADLFPLKPTLAVMDVSFISVTLILPALTHTLGPDGRIITLIKPQFEAGPSRVGKRGVVTGEATRIDAIMRVIDGAQALGWRAQGLTWSPITGQNGNVEFLCDLTPGDIAAPLGRAAARDAVRAAGRSLRA